MVLPEQSISLNQLKKSAVDEPKTLGIKVDVQMASSARCKHSSRSMLGSLKVTAEGLGAGQRHNSSHKPVHSLDTRKRSLPVHERQAADGEGGCVAAYLLYNTYLCSIHSTLHPLL
jgi:hypothetical protein